MLLPALSALAGTAPDHALEILTTKLKMKGEKAHRLLATIEKIKIMSIENGVYRIEFGHLIFERSSSSLKIKNYLKEHLRLSNRAFQESYSSGSKFLTHAMGINRKDFPILIEKIHGFLKDINDAHQSEPAEEVIEINIQAFLHSAFVSHG